MSIDEIMALADEYVSASIEDHGYRSGAASAEYLEDTKRKLLAALESLIAAPAAPQQAEPVAWRTAEKYSPDVGSWFDYYDEFATVNDKTGLQPLYLHPPTAEVQRLQSLVDRLDESNVRLRGAMHAAIEDHDEHRPLTAAIEAMRTTLLERPDDGAVQRLRAALECIEKCTTDQLNRVIARRALEGK